VGAGLGQMDYTSVIRFMKTRKPFIHATLENTTPENNLQVRDFIQKLYDEA
jgi:methionine-rich copper-binding protein CopC